MQNVLNLLLSKWFEFQISQWTFYVLRCQVSSHFLCRFDWLLLLVLNTLKNTLIWFRMESHYLFWGSYLNIWLSYQVLPSFSSVFARPLKSKWFKIWLASGEIILYRSIEVFHISFKFADVLRHYGRLRTINCSRCTLFFFMAFINWRNKTDVMNKVKLWKWKNERWNVPALAPKI